MSERAQMGKKERQIHPGMNVNKQMDEEEKGDASLFQSLGVRER